MVRKYKRNIEKLRATQGCLTDCVAYYFNVHPINVPFFIYPRKTWMKRLKVYFKKQGYNICWTPYTKVKKNILRLVVGNSKNWKTASHCVVYLGNKKVYDPDNGNAMKGEPIYQLLITKL